MNIQILTIITDKWYKNNTIDNSINKIYLTINLKNKQKNYMLKTTKQ